MRVIKIVILCGLLPFFPTPLANLNQGFDGLYSEFHTSFAAVQLGQFSLKIFDLIRRMHVSLDEPIFDIYFSIYSTCPATASALESLRADVLFLHLELDGFCSLTLACRTLSLIAG
jgi:hypothetical protein